MFKSIFTFPYFISIPLFTATFALSLMIKGTDDVLFGPFMVMMVGFLGLCVFPNFKNGWSLPINFVTGLALAFWLWLVIALQRTHVPFVSTFFTLEISILPLLFLAMILRPDREKWIPVHVAAGVLVLCGSAVWALIQFFFFFDTYGPRIHNPMLNPNNLGGLFNLGILPMLGLFFFAKTNKHAWVFLAVATLLFMGLLVTQSRGALLSLGVTGFILIVFTLFYRPLPWRRYGALAGAFIVAAVVINSFSQGSLEESIGLIAKFNEAHTVQARYALWESTFQMMKDHFWTGIGLGTFFFFYPKYRQTIDASDGFFAHMDPLQFGAETGFPAMFIFYALLVAILVRTIWAVKVLPSNSTQRLHIIAPFCAMLAITLHTHITFHLYMPGILTMMAVLLAYWYQATELAMGDGVKRRLLQPRTKNQKYGVISVFVLMGLIGVIWPARASLGVHYSKEAQAASVAGDNDKSREMTAMMGKIAPDSFTRYFEYEARFRISIILKQAKTMNVNNLRKLYDEAMYYLDEAEKRNPSFVHIWALRARTYQAVDDILIVDGNEQAIRLLHKSLEQNPLALESRMMLSNLYETIGDKGRALGVLQDGIKWPRPKGRQDIQFMLEAARLYKEFGSQENYDKLMKEAHRRSKFYGITIKMPDEKSGS